MDVRHRLEAEPVFTCPCGANARCLVFGLGPQQLPLVSRFGENKYTSKRSILVVQDIVVLAKTDRLFSKNQGFRLSRTAEERQEDSTRTAGERQEDGRRTAGEQHEDGRRTIGGQHENGRRTAGGRQEDGRNHPSLACNCLARKKKLFPTCAPSARP